MEKSHTVLFTKNKEADLVSMIAAEVCIYHTNNFAFLIQLSYHIVGPRWNSKLLRADEELRLQTQQGWCSLYGHF